MVYHESEKQVSLQPAGADSVLGVWRAAQNPAWSLPLPCAPNCSTLVDGRAAPDVRRLTHNGNVSIILNSMVEAQAHSEFGRTVRDKREAMGLGLRELAKRVGMSAAYLSKIERGQFPPPAEEKVVRIADLIELDRDELLALAGKVATDVADAIIRQPGLLTEVVRRLAEQELMNDPDWTEAISAIQGIPNMSQERAEQLIQGLKISWRSAGGSARKKKLSDE